MIDREINVTQVDTMKKWNGVGKPNLRLDTLVEVRFRDGSMSPMGTVGDWHGAGGIDSNWTHLGDSTDIIEYREIEI